MIELVRLPSISGEPLNRPCQVRVFRFVIPSVGWVVGWERGIPFMSDDDRRTRGGSFVAALLWMTRRNVFSKVDPFQNLLPAS